MSASRALRDLLLEQTAVETARRRIESVRLELARDGRPIDGEWPGTSRCDASLEPQGRAGMQRAHRGSARADRGLNVVQTGSPLDLRFLAVVVLTACGASSTTVRGPDGEDAHVISCNAAAACYEKAAKICNGDYVIREGHGVRTGGLTSHHVEIFVSCRSDLPSSAESTSASTSSPASSDREDSQVCHAASKVREDFRTYWASKSGGVLLDEPPMPRDFIVTCQSMSETVQRCMHDKYRRAHQQACTAFLARLDVASKSRIDALYLQVPAEPKPRTTAPETSL